MYTKPLFTNSFNTVVYNQTSHAIPSTTLVYTRPAYNIPFITLVCTCTTHYSIQWTDVYARVSLGSVSFAGTLPVWPFQICEHIPGLRCKVYNAWNKKYWSQNVVQKLFTFLLRDKTALCYRTNCTFFTHPETDLKGDDVYARIAGSGRSSSYLNLHCTSGQNLGLQIPCNEEKER